MLRVVRWLDAAARSTRGVELERVSALEQVMQHAQGDDDSQRDEGAAVEREHYCGEAAARGERKQRVEPAPSCHEFAEPRQREPGS